MKTINPDRLREVLKGLASDYEISFDDIEKAASDLGVSFLPKFVREGDYDIRDANAEARVGEGENKPWTRPHAGRIWMNDDVRFPFIVICKECECGHTHNCLDMEWHIFTLSRGRETSTVQEVDSITDGCRMVLVDYPD